MQRESVLRATQIEKHQRGLWLFLIGKFPQRFHPPMERTSRESIGPRELRQREIAAINEIEPVNEEPFRHAAQANGLSRGAPAKNRRQARIVDSA
jgi:hypothetical protein